MFKSFLAISLSLLIVAGSSGLGLFSHTCRHMQTAVFMVDKADSDCCCNHNACELPDSHPKNDQVNFQKSHCCETQTLVLKCDEFTLSIEQDEVGMQAQNIITRITSIFVPKNIEDNNYKTGTLSFSTIIKPLLRQQRHLIYLLNFKSNPEPLFC
jgi:hypothetical protein